MTSYQESADLLSGSQLPDVMILQDRKDKKRGRNINACSLL